MSLKTRSLSMFRTFLYAVITIAIVACVPAATRAPQMPVELAAPTPEIFNPLDPSPTPSENTLPMTCQVTDLNVYINEEWGYCFAYPTNFTSDESRSAEGMVSLYGPGLEDNANPVRVNLELTTQLVADHSSLTSLVDGYLTSFHELSGSITREPMRLGTEAAEKLEPVPGLLSSQVVMALHEGTLFTLRFHPSDLEMAKPDLEALTQTVTGSFAFMAKTARPASQSKTVSWYEFGKNISLSYDSTLAPLAAGWTVPAVPVSDQILFAESHPAYAQIQFPGFQGGRLYDLPLPPAEDRVAQVMIFQTADFPGFGDDSPQGFLNQKQALTSLLDRGLDPARCAQPLTTELALPFLPWTNAKQSFCAQPQMLEFSGGKGIRYLSHYAQDPSPVMEHQVFYTFQGLTDDGQFYVSAMFPVQTGIFPTDLPDCRKCGEPNYDPFAEWTTLVIEQLTKLNAQPPDDFAPSLIVLDELIQSIQIGQ